MTTWTQLATVTLDSDSPTGNLIRCPATGDFDGKDMLWINAQVILSGTGSTDCKWYFNDVDDSGEYSYRYGAEGNDATATSTSYNFFGSGYHKSILFNQNIMVSNPSGGFKQIISEWSSERDAVAPVNMSMTAVWCNTDQVTNVTFDNSRPSDEQALLAGGTITVYGWSPA